MSYGGSSKHEGRGNEEAATWSKKIKKRTMAEPGGRGESTRGKRTRQPARHPVSWPDGEGETRSTKESNRESPDGGRDRERIRGKFLSENFASDRYSEKQRRRFQGQSAREKRS